MPPQAEGLHAASGAAQLAIALPDQHGKLHRLADYKGRHTVVYFYPKDLTPGCTVEGKEFRDLIEGFAALDCPVIGVSTDSVESHREFAQKHALPFPLLADVAGELAQAFGVLNGKMAARATFVLGRDGKVIRHFANVTPRGHAQQVLTFVRMLRESQLMLGG